MARAKTIGNRIAPARFLMFLGILTAASATGIYWWGFERGLLSGFNLASLAFLLSCLPLFKLRTAALRQAAADNDANRWMLLVISFLLTLVVLAAVAAMLATPKGLPLIDKMMIVATLVLVWFFGNAIYTLHYTHLYYSRDDGGKDSAGVAFPATKEPDFADFAYFAFTLGVALQTSDVEITSPHFRRIVTMHCIAAFFFNLGVLALTINVLGSA